jgi:myo-inositol-1(or 4)-monophosphatase
MGESIFATGIPFIGRGSDEDHALFARELFNIMGVSAGVRRFGSAALDLAYVAAGRFDGYWEHGLKSWDIAAGILLVREAGGFVSDFSSRDRVLQSGDVVAGHPCRIAKASCQGAGIAPFLFLPYFVTRPKAARLLLSRVRMIFAP